MMTILLLVGCTESENIGNRERLLVKSKELINTRRRPTCFITSVILYWFHILRLYLSE